MDRQLLTLQGAKTYLATHEMPTLDCWSLDPSVYDFHSGKEGSCLLFLRALKNLRSLGGKPPVRIFLTKSNYHELDRLLLFLRKSGVDAITCLVGDYADPSWFPQFPLLCEVLERVAPQWQERYVLQGIPPCFVPDALRTSVVEDSSEEGTFVRHCAACALQDRCGGIRPSYLGYYRSLDVVPQD